MPGCRHTEGFRAVFAVAAGLCLLSCAGVWLWVREPAIHAPKSLEPRGTPLRDLAVWRKVVAISLLCAPQFAVLTYAAVFFHDALGLSVTAVSLALAMVQVGAILGRLWSGRWTDKHQNRGAYLKACAWLSALGFAALSATVAGMAGPWTTAGLVVLAGIMVSVWHGVAYAELATAAGVQRSGTALAMGNSGVFLVLFLTPLGASAAVAHWGWAMLWGLCALCAALAAGSFAATAPSATAKALASGAKP